MNEAFCTRLIVSRYSIRTEVFQSFKISALKTFIMFCVLGKGRIVNVTSVKGIIARPTISVYGITKFGAENFSDCLRLEMRKFGVKVSIVEPGNFGGLTGIVKDQNVINLAFKHC